MMKSREFKKIYHPKLGGYVYEHRGNGLIVDNIMKPLTRLQEQLLKNLLKEQKQKQSQ